ncbi:CHAT domain-containing protein [Puia dinghuensis]|uniref:CHAT domain-containing protein n=1 Tax=Puia dinghuensis TaxID=1792502 RepID=A0A8J2XSK6_9BACT|nr:CHAT domain-containing tetratricopeptide repeat protein [Puia dinghuensis]GGA95859.1 hypothetical protein GCM10011511_18930 [Puia dinghuensis]
MPLMASPGGSGGDGLLALYRHADSLYHLNQSTPANDSLALAEFTVVADVLEKGGNHGGSDTLLTGALLKKGILLDAGGDYARARVAYCRVLGYHPPNDSLIFVTSVLVGTVYYNLDRFDSASYYLLRAESASGRFKDRDNSVRLYNTLGALYCDNGNYRQGKNYFDKALELVRGVRVYDTAAAVSLQINIATASFRVGQYADALAIYRQLLGYRPLRDYVYENMGRAYVGMEDYRSAMDWFRRVKVEQIPGVLNEMANAELHMHRLDSCEWFLRRLREVVAASGGKSMPVGAVASDGKTASGAARVHPLDMGVNAFYAAAELNERGDLPGALASVQQAIGQFAGSINKKDAYGNPTNFTGAFAYYRLFDALVLKAELYDRVKDLAAAYATYTAALSLLRYIEKSYATDEAKLFLKKKSALVYAEALSACLRLSILHPNGDYLEQAFLIGEKSKASVITANLEETAFMGVAGPERDLLQKVNNCKYRIARLDVKSEGMTDSAALAAMTREKEGDELELSRLQKALEKDGEYYRVKYGDEGGTVSDLQGELTASQALVSLYVARDVLHVFVVTKDGLRHVAVDSLAQLEKDVEGWLDALKTTGNGHRFSGGEIGRRLYTRLVKPIRETTRGKTEWVIVPDGVFALLPWESLYADEEGKQWLVETTTMSYRFSSRLLNAEGGAGMKEGVLAFAPFASAGDGGATSAGSGAAGAVGGGSGAATGGGGSVGGEVFQRLPASREEIAGLPGVQYLDTRATKQQFLAAVNHYPIVHLATHAVSSMDDAAASFIAFYPAGRGVMDDRLYLEELYGLNLRSTRLVIISACETGQGEVAPQEGVISLARAFAYAGCGSTINSLWKADDQATSAILGRFYYYLKRGETKARALQLAKLDYLKSDAIDKSPAYWAHLVLTGDSGALYPKRRWILWAVEGFALLVMVTVAWNWKKWEKKSRRIGNAF